MTARIYHTCASAADLERARDAAPSLEHGLGWIPAKMCAHDAPWFLDNGCYRKWQQGEPADPPAEFWHRLETVDERMPRPPEFVVLPDLPGSADTIDHAAHYLRDVRGYGFPTYLAVHRGMNVARTVRTAEKWGCSGLFLGGSLAWKREAAPALVDEAHARDLAVHVGRPERAARWFLELGVDSLDTSGFARNDDWDRLARLGRGATDDTRQATLADSGAEADARGALRDVATAGEVGA